MEQDRAALAVLITLEEPTRVMIRTAKAAGQYRHEDMARSYDRISIVTIREIVEGGQRLDIPMSLEVLSAAQRAENAHQIELF
jgi:site-specific DNA-methyltransferase (adenine-specific)